MKAPESLKYSPQHLWARADANGDWQAGITDFAQDMLGDIVFVDAPAIGTEVNAGAVCGLVESVKTGSDLHAPMSGTVTEINPLLQNSPEALNDKPYETWIYKFKPSAPAEAESLLSATAYQDFVEDTA